VGGEETFDVGLPALVLGTEPEALERWGLPEEVWGRVESGKEDELKDRCPLY
jgi:hypothetical protein